MGPPLNLAPSCNNLLLICFLVVPPPTGIPAAKPNKPCAVGDKSIPINLPVGNHGLPCCLGFQLLGLSEINEYFCGVADIINSQVSLQEPNNMHLLDYGLVLYCYQLFFSVY